MNGVRRRNYNSIGIPKGGGGGVVGEGGLIENRVGSRVKGEMVDNMFPGLAQLVTIFHIKIIMVFLDFEGFSNNTRVVKGGISNGFSLVEKYYVFFLIIFLYNDGL